MDHVATAKASPTLGIAALYTADKDGARRELSPRHHSEWRPPRHRRMADHSTRGYPQRQRQRLRGTGRPPLASPAACKQQPTHASSSHARTPRRLTAAPHHI